MLKSTEIESKYKSFTVIRENLGKIIHKYDLDTVCNFLSVQGENITHAAAVICALIAINNSKFFNQEDIQIMTNTVSKLEQLDPTLKNTDISLICSNEKEIEFLEDIVAPENLEKVSCPNNLKSTIIGEIMSGNKRIPINIELDTP